MKIIIPLLIFVIPVFPAILPISDSYTSYQNEIVCKSKKPIQKPETIEQIQSIVKDALATNTHVRVIGSGHSVTDTICTDGIPLKLENFKKVQVNADKKTATIETGIELQDAVEALHQQDYALPQMASFGGITIGGAFSLGAHGTSLKVKNTLSELLVGLTIIDGNGEVRKIDDPKELDAFRVSFGLLGIVIDITVEVVPQFKLKIESFPESDAFLLKNTSQIIDMAHQLDWFQFWWFPSTSSMVISKGERLPTSVPGNDKTNLVSNVSPLISAGSNIAIEAISLINNFDIMNEVQKLTEKSLYVKQDPLIKQPAYSDEQGNAKNPAIGYSHRLMANRCNPCSWDFPITDKLAVHPGEGSVAVPLEHLANAMNDIKSIIQETPTAFPLYGLFIRFSPPSRGLFAISYQREVFHIDWGYALRANPDTESPYGLPVMQAITQLLIEKYDGRPHWGKNGVHYFSHELLNRRYPASSFTEFKKMMDKYDPKRIYSNQFGDRIFGINPTTTGTPKNVKHCAIRSFCLCKKSSDCSLTDSCSNIMGYPVCKPGLINLRKN
ncbi:unnamed protein product [Cunninghamella blakesleeana]